MGFKKRKSHPNKDMKYAQDLSAKQFLQTD